MFFFKRKSEAEKLQMHIDNLQSEDIYTQKRAAEALGRMGDQSAVMPLIKALKDKSVFGSKSYFELMGCIAVALGKLGDERAIKPLRGLIRIKLGDSYVSANSLEEATKQLKETQAALEWAKEKAKESIEKIQQKPNV